jgi:hypothetical protein
VIAGIEDKGTGGRAASNLIIFLFFTISFQLIGLITPIIVLSKAA